MKLQEGKRYVTRDGEIVGPVTQVKDAVPYNFYSIKNAFKSYTEDGFYWASKKDDGRNIVAEYVEDDKPEVKPEDLRGYGDLEKERRDFWVRRFENYCQSNRLPACLEKADEDLAEFDKRFNK